jgi:hypothetical protein
VQGKRPFSLPPATTAPTPGDRRGCAEVRQPHAKGAAARTRRGERDEWGWRQRSRSRRPRQQQLVREFKHRDGLLALGAPRRRKTCATYYDEHVPESSVEILGHSVGGITYRHYAQRAPLAFRAIMTLPQPNAFSAILRGGDSECPCCRRRFADAD